MAVAARFSCNGSPGKTRPENVICAMRSGVGGPVSLRLNHIPPRITSNAQKEAATQRIQVMCDLEDVPSPDRAGMCRSVGPDTIAGWEKDPAEDVAIVDSGVTVTGAIKRYPFRATVSMKIGLSAASPRASRSLLMAVPRLWSKSTVV